MNKLLSNSKMEALVFKAKIIIKEPNNLNQEFIVKCFLNDQSFSVSEMKIQSAGKCYYLLGTYISIIICMKLVDFVYL